MATSRRVCTACNVCISPIWWTLLVLYSRMLRTPALVPSSFASPSPYSLSLSSLLTLVFFPLPAASLTGKWIDNWGKSHPIVSQGYASNTCIHTSTLLLSCTDALSRLQEKLAATWKKWGWVWRKVIIKLALINAVLYRRVGFWQRCSLEASHVRKDPAFKV